MQVDEVAALLRDLIDESSVSFIGNDELSGMLRYGYRRLRAKILEYDPNAYTDLTADIVLTNDSVYNLATGAVSVLGASPTNTAMYRLKHVIRAGTNPGESTDELVEARTFAELQVMTNAYLLSGQQIYFSANLNETLRLVYTPVDTVDWTQIDPTDTEFIDDYDTFHEAIALMAMRRYYPRDWAVNEAAQEWLAEILNDMSAYFVNRAGASAYHVGTSVADPWGTD